MGCLRGKLDDQLWLWWGALRCRRLSVSLGERDVYKQLAHLREERFNLRVYELGLRLHVWSNVRVGY